MDIYPVDKKISIYTRRVAEEYYGTNQDPNQIPITEESFNRLHSFNPDTILYKIDKERNIVGWVVVIPTTKVLMKRFLNKEISEKEIFDLTDFSKQCDALYLCSAFVPKEYRGKGYAKELIVEAIKRLSQGRNLELFGWIYSEEGKNLLAAIEKTLERKILTRVD